MARQGRDLRQVRPEAMLPEHEATVPRIDAFALRERDVVQIEAATSRTKILDHARQVVRPYTPKLLVEDPGGDRTYRGPVGFEVVEPFLRGSLVVETKFLNVDHTQAVRVQKLEGAGQVGQATAGENVLDGQEFRRITPDIAGRRDHANTARLQGGRDAFDPGTLAKAAGVFIDADRQVPIIRVGFAGEFAVVLLDDLDSVGEVAGLDATLHHGVLLGNQSVVHNMRAILFGGVHRHVAPAGADFDQPRSGFQAQLAADVVTSFSLGGGKTCYSVGPVPFGI